MFHDNGGMPYRTSDKTRKKKDAKRTAMMQSAVKVFAEKGYHAATVRDIVNAVGVAIGTFYFYFPDKETLFTYLYEETSEFLVQAVQQGINSRQVLHNQVVAGVQAYANIALYEPAVVHLLLVGGVGAVPALTDKRAVFRENLVTAWQRPIDRAIDQHRIPDQNSRRSAEAITGAIDEIILNLLQSPRAEIEAPGAVRDLTVFVLRALGYTAKEEEE